MSGKQQFFLRTGEVRSNCVEFIRSLPANEKKPLVVSIQPLTRTLEQNAKLHAMLSDIAKQCEFNGKRLDVDNWKAVFVSAHKIATGGEESMALGLEGELISLRESTAQMSKERLASLIEYITAWGVENGVRFSDRWGFYGR